MADREEDQQGVNKQTAVVDKDRARSGRKTRHPGGSREGDKKKLKAKTPSRSPTKKEPRRKEPLWFGKRKSKSPQRSKKSETSSSASSSADRKEKKRSKSRSPRGRSRKKARTRSKKADRGPYEVGQKQRYDGRSSQDDSSDDGEDDTKELVFRAGLSGTSKRIFFSRSTPRSTPAASLRGC